MLFEAKGIARQICFLAIGCAVACWLAPASATGQESRVHAKHAFRVSENLWGPLRIAIDADDFVYVSNKAGSKISKFDPTGNFQALLDIGEAPFALTITTEKSLLVSDRETGEILRANIDGTGVVKLSLPIKPPARPSSMTVDNAGRLLVIGSDTAAVQVFDLESSTTRSFGQGVLIRPAALAFDAKNARILVAEHGGLYVGEPFGATNLIHIFDAAGNLLTQFGDFGYLQGRFTRIQGLAVDQMGRIFVVDPFQSLVTMLSETGTFLGEFGGFGSAPGQLNVPMGVAVDSKGRAWVTSLNTNTIEVFELEDVTTAISPDPVAAIPDEFLLMQNYPNPFNPGTWLPFAIPRDGKVILRIYNTTGEVIRRFDFGLLKAGTYASEGSAVYWDATNNQGVRVATGLYFYELQFEARKAVRRMLYLK